MGYGHTFSPKADMEALSGQYANDVEGMATYVYPRGYEGSIWLDIEKMILQVKNVNIEKVIINAK